MIKAYPKYQPSNIKWIGEIPEHWEVKRLKWISYINPVKSNSQFDKNSEDLVTFLPMEKVSEDGKIDTEIKKPIKDLWNGFTYFEENDIIVAKITPCFENGKGALIKNLGSKVGFGSTEFHVLRPKENIIKELLYYLTKSDVFMKLGEASMVGAAGQKRVSNSFLEDFYICYPKDIDEQKLIVSFINDRTQKIDTLFEKKQKLIDLLKEERTVIINQAVTRGLNPDAPMKDSGIEWLGEMPKHWKIKRMKYVAEIKSSNVDKKSSDNEIKVFLCNYLDVYKNEYIDNSFSFMEATANENEITKFIVKKGDVLVTKDSETPDDIANPAYIKEDLTNTICGYHLAQIRANQIELIGEYLFRLFQSKKFNSHFEVSANGITRFGLSIDSFKLVLIPLPPIEEQNEIAKYIETSTQKIHRTISRIEKEITLLQEYRTALISEVITGKIDVREAV